jgi:hypothetical protein
LDQQKINEYVDEAIQASYDLAGAVYTKGGFSKSVAKITVSGGLGASLKKSDEVVGTSQAGEQIVLTPKSNYESSATEIELVYTDGNCNVGGLDEASRVLDGCTYSKCRTKGADARGKAFGRVLLQSPVSFSRRLGCQRNHHARKRRRRFVHVRPPDGQHQRPDDPVL